MTASRLLPILTAAVVLAQERDLGLVTGGDSVRAVGFGDFGYRGEKSGQRQVAAQIRKNHAARPFQIGLTLGDNFYDDGVQSVMDNLWRTIWIEDYEPLRIPFFAALGNHDYRGNPQAQVDYTGKSKTWRMPYRYYTYAAGPVRFFALDTDEGTAGRWFFRKAWSKQQAAWFDRALARHPARWRIAYGHHPVFSGGHHGDQSRLVDDLLPILKRHGVHAYLAGHEHDLQHLELQGIQFVIAGGGGKDVREAGHRKGTVFAAGRHGFLEIDARPAELVFRWIGTEGQRLHEKALRK